MKPKDLSLIPDQVFLGENPKDFLEWTMLRAWVIKWLTYCHWYFGTAMSLDVRLDSFFEAPVYVRHWMANGKSEELIRFGLLWRLYDVVAQMGVSYRPPILCDTSQEERSSWWLLGGVSGTCFLVSSFGLIQPRAGKGVVVTGMVIQPTQPHPGIKIIHYKTLGVSDRQSILDYDRRIDLER